MTIVYALVSRQKTVLAEYTTTSGESNLCVDCQQGVGGINLFFLPSFVLVFVPISHALCKIYSNWKLSYSHTSSLGKDTSQ